MHARMRRTHSVGLVTWRCTLIFPNFDIYVFPSQRVISAASLKRSIRQYEFSPKEIISGNHVRIYVRKNRTLSRPMNHIQYTLHYIYMTLRYSFILHHLYI